MTEPDPLPSPLESEQLGSRGVLSIKRWPGRSRAPLDVTDRRLAYPY